MYLFIYMKWKNNLKTTSYKLYTLYTFNNTRIFRKLDKRIPIKNLNLHLKICPTNIFWDRDIYQCILPNI